MRELNKNAWVFEMTVDESCKNVGDIEGFPISAWVSPPPLFLEEKHSVSSLPQNSASAVPERRSISWMSLPQDCTLRMSTS